MGCSASKRRKEIVTERTDTSDHDESNSTTESILKEWLGLARESIAANTTIVRFGTPMFGFGTPAFGLDHSFIPP